MKLLTLTSLILVSLTCNANVAQVASQLEFHRLPGASVQISGRSACQQILENYKCCIPVWNNTRDQTFVFIPVNAVGINISPVIAYPFDVGLFYTKNKKPCPSTLKNGLSLRVKNITNPNKPGSFVPGPIPLAKAFIGIECTSRKCFVWPQS